MSLASRIFRVLVALAVAMPLGPGGLCCCLFADTAAPGEMTAEGPGAPRSCCDAPASEPALPASPTGDAENCDCPARDAAVEAATAVPGAPFLASEFSPIVAATLLAGAEDVPAVPATGAGRQVPPAPPGRPLYQVFASLLC